MIYYGHGSLWVKEISDVAETHLVGYQYLAWPTPYLNGGSVLMLALISIFFTVAINPVRGQSAAGVWQSLRRLNTTATVLHTTAHPDDEDGALLTWLSRGQGIRTGLFSLTRGEGGANLIGPE